MGLSTLLLAQNQFDSTIKIQQASVHESQMSKDDLGTFGVRGTGYSCGGGGGGCGNVAIIVVEVGENVVQVIIVVGN